MRFRSFVLSAALLSLAMSATTSMAQVTHNSVTLNWTTPGDDSLLGTASQFDIRFSTAQITAANFASATRWTTGVPAPAASGTNQSATVSGLSPNTTYWFAIKTADEVPNWAGLSNVLSRTTLAAPDLIRPAAIANLAITNATERTLALGWAAVGDDSLTGTATTYDIRYSTAPITAANWGAATQVSGEPAPSAPGSNQTFTINNLNRQTTYYVAIRTTDDAGNASAISNVASATTPDQTAPSSISNLAVGFMGVVWSLGATPAVEAPRVTLSHVRRNS
ncbi:MAG: hypothetical protein HOP12_00440 [Candidatus Eisenbacteria bacterium]|uniref:Fibronectin type-III domain-containing protein n=1 Tax=Eiseniibacteriota bacterium TaxID=2212470 RepID=A0A849STQ8_UNCEI|nr:hypothetical protein [Candidatus Eisenbacteria bacterium]